MAATAVKPTPGPRPVKPPPKPKSLKFVRAAFGYQGSDEDELSFEEGDLLYIVDDKSDKDWWRARCRGKEGLVPANFLATDTKASQAEDFHPMHDACRRGHVDLLVECLSNRAPVNSVDKAGNSPLHWAALAGQVECARKLLEIPQINANIKNRLGDAPLHQAAYKGHVEIVKALRGSKCDVNLKNGDGKTALDLAKDPESKSELQKWIQIQSGLQRSTSGGDYRTEDYEQSDEEEEQK